MPIRSPRSSAQQALEGLGVEHVGLGLELDAARPVDEVEERHLALPAPRGEPAGDAHAVVGLGAVLEALVARAHVGDRRHARVRVRERVDSLGAQALELGPPVGERLREILRWGVVAAAHGGPGYFVTSIFVIFSLRAGPRGTWTEIVSPRLWPSSALPTGDSLESLPSDRAGLGRADDRVLDRFARLLVLDVDRRADADLVGAQAGAVDDRRGAELLLDLGDLRLEHGLLVLGVVVLGVLGDVAELARFLDALGDFAALVVGEEIELLLELVEALAGEDDVLRHGGLPRSVGAGKAGQYSGGQTPFAARV